MILFMGNEGNRVGTCWHSENGSCSLHWITEVQCCNQGMKGDAATCFVCFILTV